MMHQPHLLFIGSTVADVVLRLPNLPHTGEDVNVFSQQVALGGCAFNAFAAAQLLGAQCTLFSPVGGGIWGDWVHNALAQRGITPPIPRVDVPNGCCYCLVEPDGERSFLCEHGAEYAFRPEWFDALPADSYTGMYVCGLEIEEPTGDVIIDYLANQTGTVFFAPGPRLCHIPPSKMARMLALSPVLHLNESEALQFACADTVQVAAQRIHSITRNTVIITLGAEGAYVLDGDDEARLPAVPAAMADAIGAGDAHIGAMMAGLAAGLTPAQAAAQANRMSAAVIETPGATLTAAQWQAWYAAHPV